MAKKNLLRAWRELNGVSVKDFAAKVGVQDSAVCKWERGRVSTRNALAVHEVTGIPLHRLRPDLYPAPQSEAA